MTILKRVHNKNSTDESVYRNKDLTGGHTYPIRRTLVELIGIEPILTHCQRVVLPLNDSPKRIVEPKGFEPSAFPVRTERSPKVSYGPNRIKCE